MGNPGQANYVTTKAGVEGLTKSSARELASHGATANAVAPGPIISDVTNALNEDLRSQVLKRVPLSRFGEGKNITYVMSFSTPNRAKYITSQTLSVSGGIYM